MARLAATDITVVAIQKGRVGRKRRAYGTISFPSGTKTYTIATGIPLPTTSGIFGVGNKVENMFLTQDLGAGATILIFKYDKTNHGLRVFRSAGFTPAGTVAQPVFTGAPVVVPSVGAELTALGTISAPAFVGVPVAAGGLAEFPDDTALGLGTVKLYYDALGVR